MPEWFQGADRLLPTLLPDRRLAQRITRRMDFCRQSAPFERPMHSVSLSPLLHQRSAGGHKQWWNQSSPIRDRHFPRVVQKPSAKRPVSSSGCGAYGSPGSLRTALANHAMRSRRGTDITPLQQTASYLWPSLLCGPCRGTEHP